MVGLLPPCSADLSIGCCQRGGKHSWGRQVNYIVGLAGNARLQHITVFMELAMQDEFERTGTRQREIGEFNYAAQSWPIERRVVIRLEYGQQGTNPCYIVTNLSGSAPQLYDQVYCQRGEAENRIKEAQVGLSATRTSCQHLQTNQFRMLQQDQRLAGTLTQK